MAKLVEDFEVSPKDIAKILARLHVASGQAGSSFLIGVRSEGWQHRPSHRADQAGVGGSKWLWRTETVGSHTHTHTMK